MILVTGATGLVGGHLLWQLLSKNKKVIAICRKNSKTGVLRNIFSFYTDEPEKYLSLIEWREADILDKYSVLQAFQNVSYVYHCAGVVSFGDNVDTLFDTNVVGTRNVVEACIERGIKKLCFVSSIAALGSEKGSEKIDENYEWYDHLQSTVYSRSKYFAEVEVRKGIQQGLNAVIVNSGVVLGYSGTNSGSSQLFYQVKKGLIFYTNGGSGYVCVQDVARAMSMLMESDIAGERFILVGENNSNKEILAWMAEGFGKRKPFVPVGKYVLLFAGIVMEFFGRIFHFRPVIDKGTARTATGRKYYSNEKIKSFLNFNFTSIQDCIKQITGFINLSDNNL